MRRVVKFLLVAILVVCLVKGVLGAENEAAVDEGVSGTYVNPATAGQDAAEGGNVTQINLTANSSTTRWQGYFGNVSGALKLGLNSNVLYDFGSGATINAVYATQDPNYDFSLLQAANAADVDTRWNYLTGIDRPSLMYTETSVIGGVTTASFRTEPVASGFNSTVLDNGAVAAKGDFAFGAVVQQSGALGFDGNDWQYQLMVPADGTETYYFFMDVV